MSKKLSENYFKDFLNFLPMAVCFVDKKGYMIDVNRQMEMMLGYKRHELVDSKLDKIFSEAETKKILDQDLNGEEFLLKGKKEDIPVNLFRQEREEDQEIFIAFSNLSQAKKIEQEVEEKVKELERFNRLATGRELRMVELKREKAKLQEENKKLRDEKSQLEVQLNKLQEKQNEE